MAGKKSFIERVQPSRSRSKLVDWLFETDQPTKVRVRVLGADELEAANLETVDHFRELKKKVAEDTPAFIKRERTALVFRAYETQDGAPLAEDVDELAKQPEEVLGPLYAEFSRYQADVTQRPMNQGELDALVDGLKKNTLAEVLPALPSTWLIKLITTLASQLAVSTTASEPG